MTEKDNTPFYKEIFYKIENDLGPIDTLIGLGLGAVVGVTVCGLYWRHAWLSH